MGVLGIFFEQGSGGGGNPAIAAISRNSCPARRSDRNEGRAQSGGVGETVGEAALAPGLVDHHLGPEGDAGGGLGEEHVDYVLSVGWVGGKLIYRLGTDIFLQSVRLILIGFLAFWILSDYNNIIIQPNQLI